jgi:hypothetical protein
LASYALACSPAQRINSSDAMSANAALIKVKAIKTVFSWYLLVLLSMGTKYSLSD